MQIPHGGPPQALILLAAASKMEDKTAIGAQAGYALKPLPKPFSLDRKPEPDAAA